MLPQGGKQRVSSGDERLPHAVVSRRAISAPGGSGGIPDPDDRDPDEAAEMTLGAVMKWMSECGGAERRHVTNNNGVGIAAQRRSVMTR